MWPCDSGSSVCSRASRRRTGGTVATLAVADSESRGASRASEVTIVAHHVGVVGGMERILAELAAGLRRRGHAVTVIAYACDLPAGADVTFRRIRGPSRPFVLGYPWFMLAGSLAVRRWRRGLVLAMGAIVFNEVDIVAIQYCQQVGPAGPSRPSWALRLNAAGSRVR